MANPYRLVSSSDLAQVIESTGTSIVYDPVRCQTNKILGYYTLEWNRQGDVIKDEMGLCVNNHRGDISELGDTLRHEGMHVAQACNNGDALLPWDKLMQWSTPSINRIVSQYPAEHHHVELEAFVAAHHLSNAEVARIIKSECSK